MEDSALRLTKHSRIGIIGAGPAGLTAAETLRTLGYQNITLLERATRAGGKCHSILHDGRSYELGAGIVAKSNPTVLSLAKHYNVPVKKVPFGESVFVDPATGHVAPERLPLLQLASELLRTYRPLLKKSGLAQPGFRNLTDDLCQPFSTWAKQHNLQSLPEEFAHFFTGFGYGYFASVPAAYVLKYYSWDTLKAFATGAIYMFPDGIQHLWDTIARTHTIVYDAKISHITRGSAVTVTLENQTLTFDVLIVTSPLDEALTFLDASREEQRLFSSIRTIDYRTYACFVNNFPNKSGYLPENYSAQRAGEPVFWYQRYPDSNLYTFYVLADETMDDHDVEQRIRVTVKHLGGSLERVLVSAHWKYFPHVDTETLASGFYDTLDALQGKHRTFYAGELLNFSTVGLTSQYSEHLVTAHFPKQL